MLDVIIAILTYLSLIVAVLVLIIVVLAWFFRPLQHALVYHPDEPAGSRTRFDGPREFGVPRYESLEINTADDFTLRGYVVFPTAGTARFTIVYFHGNAGNAGHRTPIARMLADRLHANVVMMDYRCYGLSDSKGTTPDDVGLQQDGRAILEYCLEREDFARHPLFVMGTSLGGAVAIYLSSLPQFESRVRGWIVENTFSSLSDMADVVFVPLISRTLPGWRGRVMIFTLSRIIKPLTIHVGWPSIGFIRQATGPFLFISASNDEMIPPAHMRALFDAAIRCSMRRFVTLPQSTHNDAPAAAGYCDHILEFVTEVLQRAPATVTAGRALGSV